MDRYEQSLNALDELLSRTSKEEILSIYNSIKDSVSGPTIKEYFDGCGISVNFTIPDGLKTFAVDENAFKPPSMNYKIPENITPNFSGYFFCVTLHYGTRNKKSGIRTSNI